MIELEYAIASTFGAVTPFCSCSSVPLFIGFVKGGIPLGVTFAFLITSPLVNEVAVAIFLGMFGFKTTVIYVTSAIMHGYVPEGFFEQYIGKDTWYAIPLAVILGVPMYANATGIIPIIQVFVAKGIPIGTTLAFMMAAIGLSIPEATLLKKVTTVKQIVIFFTVVTICIIVSGYVFNIIL